jgi:hypothetical protein
LCPCRHQPSPPVARNSRRNTTFHQGPPKYMDHLSRESFFLPLAIAFIITFALGLYYWDMLPVGTIHWWDEYSTLDRSNSFLVKNDWLTVYALNSPDFKKPPLQYWLTALAMKNSSDLEFALRITSYIFGIGLLICTGFLAYLINPTSSYTVPSAVILLSGSSMFWGLSLSALLETGAAFFFTLAIIGTILAIRQPKYWYLVTAAVGCGALQKTPAAAVFVISVLLMIAATSTFHDIKIRYILSNTHFRIAALITLTAIVFWPAVQLERYGFQSIQRAYIQQMFQRFRPCYVSSLHGPSRSKVCARRAEHRGGNARSLEAPWYQWLIYDEALLWIPGLLSVLIIPFLFRGPESFIPPFIVLGFCLLMGMASGSVYPRYTILIFPLLAASMAAMLTGTLPRKSIAVVVAAIFCLISGGPFKSADDLGLLESTQTQYVPLLERFRTSLGGRDTFIYCRWATKFASIMYPGTLSYFASNGKPIVSLRGPGDLSREEHAKHLIVPPYRGLCLSTEFDELKKWLSDYNIVEQSNGYVHWTSEGSVPLGN